MREIAGEGIPDPFPHPNQDRVKIPTRIGLKSQPG